MTDAHNRAGHMVASAEERLTSPVGQGSFHVGRIADGGGKVPLNKCRKRNFFLKQSIKGTSCIAII